jgi:hypothetical protein
MMGIALLAFAIPFTAGATVKKEGTWPTHEPKVDLEFDGKPSDGLKELAKEAEWSLVLSNSVGIDEAGSDVHVDVDSQPADAVLEALFAGRDVIAYRNGTLITVMPNSGNTGAHVAMPAVPPPPNSGLAPSPPAPDFAPAGPAPIPTVTGEDRSVVGGSMVIKKDEVAHTVSVAGGSLKVEGVITGDLVVAGGSAKIVGGGRVVGNVVVFGGSLKLEDKARIDGDVAINGGSLKREDGASIGGTVVDGPGQHGRRGRSGSSDDHASSHDDASAKPSGRSRLSEAAHDFGQAMTKTALLFVLGCVLLALLAPRMEKVRVEIASRPMRAFATGLVGTIFGSIGAGVLLTVLCVTVIGIPVAVVGVLAAVLAVYGAIASVLTTVGAAVVGHRTQNPYLHLLLGCAAFLVLFSIPYVGWVVSFVVTMTAIGALILTRVGGLLDRKPRVASLF